MSLTARTWLDAINAICGALDNPTSTRYKISSGSSAGWAEDEFRTAITAMFDELIANVYALLSAGNYEEVVNLISLSFPGMISKESKSLPLTGSNNYSPSGCLRVIDVFPSDGSSAASLKRVSSFSSGMLVHPLVYEYMIRFNTIYFNQTSHTTTLPIAICSLVPIPWSSISESTVLNTYFSDATVSKGIEMAISNIIKEEANG